MGDEKIRIWLEMLAERTTSTEQDSLIMQQLLRHMGYAKARVVSGIVYLEGHGTLESPPQSIHTLARVLLEAFNEGKRR